MEKLFSFIKYYIISMRLHFGFITGIGGWLGIAYYEHLYMTEVELPIKIFALLVLFLSYGINQVINDYTGIEEDKINAPNRPMVSGKLPPKAALITSVILMALVGIITLIIEPLALLPVVAGVLINFLYEYAKSISILGNIFFGLSMMACPLYGFIICGPFDPAILNYRLITITILMLSYTTGLMTYFTYFKDYHGDKEAGKITYVVKHGLNHSKKAGVAFSLIPSILLGLMLLTNIINFEEIIEQFYFCIITGVTITLQLWTAYLYYKFPEGERTFFHQRNNIQACVMSLIIPLAGFNGELAMLLALFSYIAIEFIFSFHRDAKA